MSSHELSSSLPARGGPARLAVFILVGVGSAALGLVPWLVSGMRLPLQNLWAAQTSPEEMPISLLPFSQYSLTLIVAMILVGSAIAGAAARATRGHHPGHAPLAVAGGLFAVQVSATVQAALTVSSGLRDSSESTVYLAALVVGTSATILVGLLVLFLIARAPRAGASVAVSIAAVATGTWAGSVVSPVDVIADESALAALAIVRWIPAVIVGLAIAWSGLGTAGRVAGAIGSLLVLWIGPTLATAVSAAAGTRVLARYPAEMVEFGAQVFAGALWAPGGSIRLIGLAVVVAVVGFAVRWGVRRRRVAPAAIGGTGDSAATSPTGAAPAERPDRR